MARAGFDGFDFSGVRFGSLDFESFTGSKEDARPFRSFEQARSVAGMAAVFSGEAAEAKQGAHDHLTAIVTELERTRELTAKLHEARLASLQADLAAVDGRLTKSRDLPKLERESRRLKIAVKARDEESGLGLSGVLAEAFIKEGLKDKKERILERQTTDADGNVTMTFDRGEIPECEEVFVRFYTASGTIVPESEICFARQWGRVALKTLDLSAPEELKTEIAAAKALSAQRNARRASVNQKLHAVQDESTAAVGRIDEKIVRYREWIGRLEEAKAQPASEEMR